MSKSQTGAGPSRWGVRVTLPLAGDAGDIEACSEALGRARMEVMRASQELACVQLGAFFDANERVRSIEVFNEERFDDNGIPLGMCFRCEFHVDDAPPQGEFEYSDALVEDANEIERSLDAWGQELSMGGPIMRDGAAWEAARRIMGERAGDWLARVQARELDRVSSAGGTAAAGPGFRL